MLKKSYDALDAVYNGSNQNRYPHTGYGLARAMMCLGFAMAYDWCYNRWSVAQRGWVRGRLVDALDAWPSYSHQSECIPSRIELGGGLPQR